MRNHGQSTVHEPGAGSRKSHQHARTDLYSLGCVMYECLVGGAPFLGKTQLDTMLMHMNNTPTPLRHKARNPSRISPALESVVMALLEKNPNNRYQSMDQVVEDLRSIQRGKVPTNLPFTHKMPAVSAKKKWLIGSLCTACILAIVCSIIWVLRPIPSQPIADVTRNPIDDAAPAIPENSKTNIEDQIAKQTGYVNEDSLFGSGVHPDDMKAFEKPGSEFITYVSLPELGLNDKSIEPFSHLIRLKFLDLEHNQVSDMHAIKNLTNLRVLNLKQTDLSSQGMSVIGGLSNLVLLNLQHTPIQDKDLKQLYGLKGLRAVHIFDCNLSKEAIASLEKALPNCVVLNVDTQETH